MKFLLIFVASLALASAAFMDTGKGFKTGGKDFLLKQKRVFDLLNHVTQQNVNDEIMNFGKDFVLEANTNNFMKTEVVKDFMGFMKRGLFPKFKIFSLTFDSQRDEAIALFHLFFYAKDFETFFKTACWARQFMNEGMFVYSFTVAVLHRTDCQGIVLPAPYEIYPFYFVSSDVIEKANFVKQQGFIMDNKLAESNGIISSGPNSFMFYNNFSASYDYNDFEQKLSYFTNDIGLNSYYFYFHVDYPFWMGGQEFGLNKDRRGELYFYVHQQLMARYYLERLSNNLGEIPRFSWFSPIKTGFNPNLRFHNGYSMPMRSQDFMLNNEYNVYLLQEVDDYERRIRNAIDMGFVTLYDGSKIFLKNYQDIEFLGRFVQGNKDLGDIKFFDYLSVICKFLLGGGMNTFDEMTYVPSAIEQFHTTMRDPMFYQLYTRFMRFFFRFKDNLPSYTKSELFFPGVKVENVEFTPLTTFFEEYDFDITNGFFLNKDEIDSHKENFMFYARQMRLNHKPFSVNFNIMSDKDTDVSIRMFLGPKYDSFGRQISCNDNKYNFVELDHFFYTLKNGKNIITRKNVDFARTVIDRTPSRFLYNKVMNGLSGNGEFKLDMTEAHNGWPLRLLLPKGKVGGMFFQVFVMVSPFRPSTVQYGTGFPQQYSGGVGSGARFYEDLPFGFPLDRPIDESFFFVPNMFMTDIKIFHTNFMMKNDVSSNFAKKEFMGNYGYDTMNSFYNKQENFNTFSGNFDNFNSFDNVNSLNTNSDKFTN